MDNPKQQTIADLFDLAVQRGNSQKALGVSEGVSVTWESWSRLSLGVHADIESLERGGFSKHQRLLICQPPIPYAVTVDIAATKLRVTRIPEAPGSSTPISEHPFNPHGFVGSIPHATPHSINQHAESIPLNDSVVGLVAKTAGTSGEPRGVMLTEQNLFSNAVALSEASGGDGDELRLSFLPMEHLYARTCDLYTWIVRGSRLVLAESPKTVFRDAKLVRPTTINGVPYFFQKAVDLADREGVSLKTLLGGEIKRCYCGGAALSPAIEQRFFDEGVPLYTGYGLTEASPVVTVNRPDAHKHGTVGKPLPGVEVRIADDGEVLVKGPNVMLGYWNDPEATADTLKDGWLHTGDLGKLDSEGFLTITGRKKELIVLSTGKNVAPSRVEALLAASPWIEQACILGDDQKGLRALIVPNPDRLRAEVRRRRLWVWSKRGALHHEAIRALYREEIDRCLAGAAREEQVHAFALVSRGFDQDRGEMTAKLSLRRDAIERGFARDLSRM